MSFLGGYSRRYSFGAVSESEVAKFAKKVAEGKKATTDFATAAELINRLAGWHAAPALVAFPADSDRVRTFIWKTQRVNLTVWGAITAKENASIASRSYADLFSLIDRGAIAVYSPDAAAAPIEGVVYVGNLFDRDSSFQTESIGRLHIGVTGLIVTAPSVSSAKVPNPVAIGSDPKDPDVFGLGSFWTWAKNTNFSEAVKSLASATVKPPTEQEEALQRIGTLEHTGICPVCGRYQKFHGVSRGRIGMYDHGYQFIDGWWKQGSCRGVDYPPFEVSNAGTLAYIKALDGWINGTIEALSRARSGTESFNRQEQALNERGFPIYERVGGSRMAKMVTITFTPESAGYAEVQAAEIRKLTGDLASLQDLKTRMEAKARSWQRVPTYDEVKAGRLLY